MSKDIFSIIYWDWYGFCTITLAEIKLPIELLLARVVSKCLRGLYYETIETLDMQSASTELVPFKHWLIVWFVSWPPNNNVIRLEFVQVLIQTVSIKFETVSCLVNHF